jgi:transcriptional regulator with XRE-family HTH domain
MSDSPENTEIGFGSWLKQHRLERQVSLEEIAAVTKVHIAQLKMLEQDEWKDLPAPAFVRGFLLCYARHLDLDEEDVLRRYKTAMGSQIKTIESVLPQGNKNIPSLTRPKVRVASTPNFQKSPGARDIEVRSTPALTPKKIAAIVIGLIVVICLVLLISLGKKSDSKSTSASKPVAPATATATTAQADPGPGLLDNVSELPAQAPAPQFNLELLGVEDSWVNVKIGDQNPQGFSLKAGDRRSFVVSPQVHLVLSNAGAVEIKWDNTHYSAPGFRGDVRTLNLPEALSDLTEKKIVPRRVIAPRSVPTESTAPAAPAAPAPILPGSAPNNP